MNDVTGKVLAVMDRVVFIPQGGYSYSLARGIVTGFTPKKVKIQCTDGNSWTYSGNSCLKFPEQVAKV